MKAFVDSDTCTGCGLCVETCSQVFEMAPDDDVAVSKVDTVPAEAEEDCKQAADECPVDAISIED